MSKKIIVNINIFYITIIVIIVVIIFMFIQHIKLMNKLKHCKNIVTAIENKLINDNFIKEYFENEELKGEGSSFAQPILAKWIDKNKAEITYESTDSIKGIKAIKEGKVKFAVTDIYQTKKELKAIDEDLIQFPLVIGGIVPMVNIKDLKEQIKLTGEVLAKIFLGEIEKWNDEEIKKLNKDLKLPDLKIKVAYRSDPSGTSYIFSNYLSKVSDKWKKDWEGKNELKLKHGDGKNGSKDLAKYIKDTEGSIGYVEYSYAKSNKDSCVLLENKDGKYPKPDEDSFKAAVEEASWDKDSEDYGSILNKGGKDTWPITCATFVLMKKSNEKLAKFFKWCLEDGDDIAEELEYVPLPEKVKKSALAELK